MFQIHNTYISSYIHAFHSDLFHGKIYSHDIDLNNSILALYIAPGNIEKWKIDVASQSIT